MCYSNSRGVLYNVVRYGIQQPLQFRNPRANAGADSLRLALASSVFLDVVGVSFFPRLLAVFAHCTIQRVLLHLFAMVFGAAAKLAFAGAADFLMRMAARRLELGAAIGACSIFEIEWAHG